MITTQDVLAMQQRRFGLQSAALRRGPVPVLANTPSRGFFGRKKDPEETAKDDKKDTKKAEEKTAKEETAAAEEGDKEAKTGEDKEEKKAEETKDKEESSTSSSSTSSEEEEAPLSAKDVKRIKQLFNEQETEIASLNKRIAELEKETIRKEKEVTLARIEFTKQVKENEQTVQRYRKMIEDEKEFAITKFAKDLLEVRDAVRMAL